MRKRMKQLNEEFWAAQYRENDTYWNAGSITTPLKEYFDQVEDKNIKILIPGVGHGHELLYLYRNGFTNVTAVDITREALQIIREVEPDFPSSSLVQADFFEYSGTYDLIVEQTFFCSLQPELRASYVSKMNQLLKPKGKLIGLLFDFCFTEPGPPFGGSNQEYRELFSQGFSIRTMESAYNSIKPRQGRELFIIIEKND